MIRLRVVGVFYDKEFQASGIATIKDLLDMAKGDKAYSFSYDAVPITKTIGCVPTNCRSLKGFSNRLSASINPSLSGSERQLGKYEIYECVSSINDSVIAHVWQYYVIRKGSVVSNLSGGTANRDVSPAVPTSNQAGFTPFDLMPIEDGDEVVWRNVSIVRLPQE